MNGMHSIPLSVSALFHKLILLWFLFSNWKRLIAPTSILFEASFLHVYFCAISSFIFQRKYNKMDQSKHTHRHTELSSFCKSRRIFTILHGRHINDCKEKDKISLGKINPTPLPFSALFIPYKFYQVDSSIFLRTQFFFFA